MASAFRSITDIRSAQNLLKTEVGLAPAVVDGIPAFSRETEIHATWQTTGMNSYDAVTGESTVNGQRIRLGTNVTSYAVDDKGTSNGNVLTLEVNKKSPGWKAEQKQSLLSMKKKVDFLVANYDVFIDIVDGAFDSPEGVVAIGKALVGWVEEAPAFIVV